MTMGDKKNSTWDSAPRSDHSTKKITGKVRYSNVFKFTDTTVYTQVILFQINN